MYKNDKGSESPQPIECSVARGAADVFGIPHAAMLDIPHTCSPQ